MNHNSETQKIRPRILKYCKGRVIDIGCGHDKVTTVAYGVDVRPLPGVDHVTSRLNNLSEELKDFVGGCDVVYSSHCLEHFDDDQAALEDWSKLLKIGGVLVLYLPDDDHYDNASNPEHLHRYKHETFIQRLKESFDNLEILDHGPDVGHDRYSFFVVAARVY